VYAVGADGATGNEDLGTLSASYVFAAIALFPQTPGRAELLVGSPLFPKVEQRRYA